MNTNLFWFRNDLRVTDNTGLSQAVNNGPTVAIYIATPQQWAKHNDAPIKIDFWRRNLALLKEELSFYNIPLIYFQVPAYNDISLLFHKLSNAGLIKALYFNNEYPLNERKRDGDVFKSLTNSGINVHRFHDDLFCDPMLVKTKMGEPFKVFTPFSRACRPFIPEKFEPLTIQKQILPDIQLINEFSESRSLNSIDWPRQQKWWLKLWPAGEKHARNQLKKFASIKLSQYSSARDIPSVDGTSKISAYLNSGILSCRTCWNMAGKAGYSESVNRWKTELLWREFYRHITCHYSHICKGKPWNRNYDHFPWIQDDEAFVSWCKGETGVPLIDAAMHQLLATGWMHNRLRMVVAMYLTKHLLIDWRKGETWFMQHLIDGDFASNNGGWQWSASTGTDASPYFRIFNPVRQSERFDPEGKFIRQWIPELAELSNKEIHYPFKSQLNNQSRYYPPLIDLPTGRDRAIETFKQFRRDI